MSWRDQLRKVTIGGRTLVGASFRSVPFLVDTAERTGGRRTVEHKYPGRDGVYHEDLGAEGREFTIEGYVVGDDYLAQRDALLDALEAAGPGELVHPYHGTRLVIVSGKYRLREEKGSGGIAQFSIPFAETTSDAPFPTTSIANVDRAAASADAAEVAIGDGFLAAYSAGQGVVDFSGLASLLEEAGTALDSALAPIVAGTQELASLKRSLDEIVLDADSLVRKPIRALGALNGVLRSFGNLPLRPGLGLSALLTAYGFVPSTPRPAPTTATREQEAKSYDAVLALAKTLVLVEAARLALTWDFDSYDAAVSMRDAVCDRLDEQMAAADDQSYAALEQLRADLVLSVPGEDRDLPRLVRVTPSATVPSLVLAHRLYGDVSLEGDLVARNRIARPGFVPGGIELEVLSRG